MSDGPGGRLVRGVILLVGGLVAIGVGWFVWVVLGGGSLDRLLSVGLVILTGVAGLKMAGRAAGSVAPSYQVAEVAVEGPITRDGGGGLLPATPGAATADDLVEQIELADEDAGAEALLVRLNTPGGEVVPSDDIRRAAMAFDGPTVAYAEDTCASGGYWIASGCDEIYARDGSIVGSIGVIGSLVNATGLAEKLGLSYEQLTAGEYKDAGTALKELTAEEREYLQGLIDGYYDQFVDRVATARDIEEDAIRDTEARVYLGEAAADLGLVDHLVERPADVEDAIADELGRDSVTVREFEPQRRLTERLQIGAARVAYALGAGAAGVLGADAGQREPLQLRL